MTDAGTHRFHGVHFYDSTDAIARVVTAFLGAGFVTGEPAVVIATPPHRNAIARALSAVSFSIDALQESGLLLLMDARATLSAIMPGGMPDAARFESMAGHAIDRADAPARTIRVYDEMVNLLWQDGGADDAIALERLWDQLTVDRQCLLLCGHDVGSFVRAAGRQSVCARHTHVLASNGIPHPLEHT
jgi:hypothetical protein